MTRIAIAIAEPRKVVGAMTALAVQAFVAAQQRKSRDSHVIERELCPGRAAVAVDALCAVAPAVHVVLAVAIVASLSDLGEIVAAMTAFTTDRSMRACQRKASAAVIKRRFRPRVRVVAGTAVFPERARVNVVCTMAGDTLHRCRAMCLANGMTVVAGGDGMCSEQREIRQIVIEGRLVKIDDVNITTFMFGMAAGAFVSLSIWQMAVKAQERFDVFTDFRVARNAQFILRLVGQRRVTRSAVCFGCSMTLNDRAGHDQPLLQLACLDGCRSRQQQQHE